MESKCPVETAHVYTQFESESVHLAIFEDTFCVMWPFYCIYHLHYRAAQSNASGMFD